MKHKLFRWFALLGVVVLPVLAVSPAYAAAATLYLSPSSGSVANGGTLTVSVRESSGSEPVNAVQANISYPASQLQFLSISSSSAFSVAAQSTGGGGLVQIGRGALPSVTDDQLVATVQFKALIGNGTASLSFAAGSSVVSATSNTNIMTSSPGGGYSLTTPASSPAPSPTPAPASSSRSSSAAKSTSTPSPTSAPIVAKDTTPPTITAIAASSITTGAATITWTTSEPASSEVDYGLTSGYGLTAVDASATTGHSVVLNSPLIVPGTTYHFAIKNIDAAGNHAASSDHEFTTKGAVVTVTVTDAAGRPVRGAVVAFNGQSSTTDAKGRATIANLPIGNSVGTVTVNGTQTIEVVRVSSINPTGAPQAVSFKLSAHTAPTNWIVTGLCVLCVLAALWVGYMVGRGRLAMVVGRVVRLPQRMFQRRANVPSVRPVAVTPPTVIAPESVIRSATENPAEQSGGSDRQSPQRPANQ